MNVQPKTSTSTPFMTMATNHDLCAYTLVQGKLPVANPISTGHFAPTQQRDDCPMRENITCPARSETLEF